MKKLFVVFLLTFTAAFVGADLFDDIQKARVYQLADAYYQVGIRYTELGKKELGAAYKAQALALYPGYLDAAAKKNQPSSATAPTPDTNPPQTSIQITGDPGTPAVNVLPLANTQPSVSSQPLDRPQVRKDSIQGDKIVKIQVSGLLRSFINQDTQGISRVIAPTLEVSGEKLSKDEVIAKAQDFFQKNDTTVYGPSTLVNLSTMKIEPVTGTENYTVTLETVNGTDLTAVLPFWKPILSLTFLREGDLWKLSAVN